jgi:hypothetical protein
MPDLSESLHRFLTIDGVHTAALIDVATGMVVQSAGVESPELPDAASGCPPRPVRARCAKP